MTAWTPDAGFSVDDAREELERLRAEETPAAPTATDADGMCPLPMQVPALPDGLQVSAEMKQLRELLLTPSRKKTKLSFCGMGGVGKTTISAWLVREREVRGQFGQVVWATLGQEPNLHTLQEAVHSQLTGKPFGEAEERKEQLRQAMAGKAVLLVFDDLWEKEHAQALDFIDEDTASKVVISSRVRDVLDGSEIVDIGVPTEDELSCRRRLRLRRRWHGRRCIRERRLGRSNLRSKNITRSYITRLHQQTSNFFYLYSHFLPIQSLLP